MQGKTLKGLQLHLTKELPALDQSKTTLSQTNKVISHQLKSARMLNDNIKLKMQKVKSVEIRDLG